GWAGTRDPRDPAHHALVRPARGSEGAVVAHLSSTRTEVALVPRTRTASGAPGPSIRLLRVERAIVPAAVQVRADGTGGIAGAISKRGAISAECALKGGHGQTLRLDHGA